MSLYNVYVRLEGNYSNIEAENEDEAFIIASDFAMEGGDWQYDIELVGDDTDEIQSNR